MSKIPKFANVTRALPIGDVQVPRVDDDADRQEDDGDRLKRVCHVGLLEKFSQSPLRERASVGLFPAAAEVHSAIEPHTGRRQVSRIRSRGLARSPFGAARRSFRSGASHPSVRRALVRVGE